MAKSPSTKIRNAPTRTPAATPQYVWYLLLFVLPLIAYFPLHDAGFIWDDDSYILNNHTLTSLDGLRQIWFVPTSIPQYYPLVHTTFWVQYQLWGVEPLGYHVVNVLLHGIAAVLAWRVLLRLDVPGAWLAAAVFAVHPVMVESVAWITERKNVLSLPLALAALLYYLRFAPADPVEADRVNAHRWRSYWIALAFFVAALLSKTVVCTLPAVLLVIYWWKRGRITWQDVVPLAPLFAVGIGAGAVTAWLEKHHVGASGEEWTLLPIERVLVAGRAAWFYAAKLAWPRPLIFFYPRWDVDARIWWQYLYPLGALALIVALWSARGRIGRGPLAAVLIFVGVLTPALGFIDVFPFLYSFVADHFQYHASLALIALAAAGAALVSERWKGVLTSGVRLLLGGGLLGGLALMTFVQSRVYHNLETLYRAVLAKNPSAWIAYVNLSNHLSETGRKDQAFAVMQDGLEARGDIATIHLHYASHLIGASPENELTSQQLEEAIEHYQTALQIQPRIPDGDLNLGVVLSHQGRIEEAIVHFNRALELVPKDEEAAFLLGKAHFERGNQLMQEEQFERAARHYGEAIRSRSDSAQARNNLGIALMNLGQTNDAIEAFREAVRIDPQHQESRANLARALETVP